MYNILNKIYSYFYSNFVKRFYKNVLAIEDKEDVYYRKNKLVVLVKNKEIGNEIYEIIKTLKNRKETFFTHNMIFKINKYFIDKQRSVQSFCIDFRFMNKQKKSFSREEKLLELVTFVDNMEEIGYVLDDSVFENEKCNNISDFLSLFKLKDGDVKDSKGCLIKYIHYILSEGTDFNEFYEKIVNNPICSESDFPYNLPIINMCYNYFLTGDVPENIYEILQKEIYQNNLYDNYHRNYLIANKSCLETNLEITETNSSEYTIYDKNIKIFHSMSSDFKEFLEANKYKHEIWGNRDLIEEIDRIIIDFNGNIIGYKFTTDELQSFNTISEINFKNQSELFDFLYEMNIYLFNEIRKVYLQTLKSNKDFDIEKTLIISMKDSNISFKITSIQEVFYIVNSDENWLKCKIMLLFFKLYLVYLSQKYGEIHTKDQLLDIIEVRYLSPILAKEFVNYVLDKSINYDKAIDEFYKFLYITKTSADNDFVYDSRFKYNPFKTNLLFDYEVEKKYGINIEKRMNEQLADGKLLITFAQSRKISKVKRNEEVLKAQILEQLWDIEDSHIKLIGISEVILSNKIDNDGMYKVLGYITDTIKGDQLVDDFLLNISNRDFLKISGHLFSKLGIYSIPLNTIWMTHDFVFYINILDENFKIDKCKSNFIDNVVNYLIEKGYNSNAFIDLDLHLHGKDLINLANNFDSYCDEHKIYYDSSYKICPVCCKTKYIVPENFEESAVKVLEDVHANHYRIENQYNLKVYKKSDISDVEKNIDKSIERILHSKKLDLNQGCFIPYKKAVDKNNQFIGYIYFAVQFDNKDADIDLCVDIKDQQNLQNLPRLMSLIRLILQIKEITGKKLGFIKNPFSYVFLSKGYKKQMQILNIDFLSEEGSVENTIIWTCEYISEILASDDSIEVDISKCSNDLDCILDKLEALASDMTKYCSIHKVYYKRNYLFCPKCIDKNDVESLEIEEIKKSNITSKKLYNEGGEAFIYDYENELIAKVFKENEVNFNYELKSITLVLVMKKKEVLEDINKQNLKYEYIIPQKIFVDKKEQNIFGYVMKKVKNGIPLSSLRDKVEVKRIGFTKKDIFEILITVGQGIETLHANNIYIGDLNGRNILFDINKNVYFIDFDGMGIDNVKPEFCTDGYIDPISKKTNNITMKDDWYSFAVQAFYYLTFTHPFNGIYSIKIDGRDKTLELVDKMEQRISLLGNHGMKVPVIAEPWDWMIGELKEAFLNIFEGDSRESILPYLIRQYEIISKEHTKFDKIIRINSKFIAKELRPFEKDVEYIINHFSAIYKNEKGYNACIFANNKEVDISLPNYGKVTEILLSEDSKIAFVIFASKIIAIDLCEDKIIYETTISDVRNVVVNGSSLYFSRTSDGENIIFQIDFIPDSDIKEQAIKFLTQQETKRLYVKFNSKFILVKKNTDYIDEIYCNSEQLCTISSTYENVQYNILYDDISKLWLVVNHEGKGIVINSGNANYKKLNIQESVNDVNIHNISFYKGIIYIPNYEYLHIININDQTITKKMECHKIMTSNSKLYNINNNGFSVITNNTIYEVIRE